MKKILLIAAGLLLLFLAAVLAGGWWLLSTPEGQRRLLVELARRAEITIEAGQVEGRLLDHLVLTDVTLQWPEGLVRCAVFELRWRPAALLQGKLAVDELVMTGAEVSWLASPDPEPKPDGIVWPRLEGWPLRLRATIDQLRIEQLALYPPEGETVHLEHLAARLEWRGGVLSLEDLDATAAGYRLRGEAAAGLRRPLLRYDVHVLLPTAAAGIDGLAMRADLTPTGSALLAGPLELRGFAGTEPEGLLTGTLEVRPEAFALIDFRLTRPGRDATLSGSAELHPFGEQPAWSVQAELAGLDLLEDLGVKTALGGRIAATGTLTDYRGSFALANERSDWQSARLSGAFAGDVAGIELTGLQGVWLGGEVAGALRADWNDGLGLQATVQGRSLDPAVFDPRWPGQVSFDASGEFLRPPTGPPQARLRGRLLDSTLHGLSLTGRIDADMTGNDVRITAVELNGDGFAIAGSGRLHERLDFSAEIARLSVLLPEVQGALRGKGWLRWRDGQLAGELDGQGQYLSRDDLRIDDLRLTASLQGDEPTIRADITASGIALRDWRLQQAAAHLRGTEQDHALDFTARWSDGEVRGSAAGGWRDNLWSGAVTRFDGRHAGIGPWRLDGPALLEAGPDRIDLAELHLVGRDGESLRLAGDAARKAEETDASPAWQGRLSAAWSALNLTRLQPWLPDGIALTGRLTGEADTHLDAGRQLRMTGEARIDAGRLRWRTDEGEIAGELRAARLAWNWHGETLSGDLSLALGEYGEAQGAFRLPLPARLPVALEPDGPLQLDLDGRMRESGLLSAVFPGLVTASRGELAIRASARGTWQTPELGGSLQLTGAGAYFPAAGITLREVALTGELAGNELRITRLTARSGDGRINGSGSVQLVNWRPTAFRGKLGGERFVAVHLPEVQLLVSPELTIEGTAERLRIRGDIAIPELMVLGRERRGVILESPDVVVADMEPATERAMPLELDIQVQVRLGERVLVKVAGLDARLAGAFALRVAGPGRFAANGEVSVVQGIYSAYGTQLRISRGRLLYSGGPIDQPTLDVLALRTVGEVSAGVQIGGTPRLPVLTLYSVPALPDTDILSYIVLGQPLGTEPGQFSALNAAAGALLSRGQSVVLQDQLKSQLGIDVIQIEGGGDVAGSMVTIGKYLSPKLYLSFGQALFTNASEARLRYSITPKWELESRTTGEKSGVDLYYKIEFD